MDKSCVVLPSQACSHSTAVHSLILSHNSPPCLIIRPLAAWAVRQEQAKAAEQAQERVKQAKEAAKAAKEQREQQHVHANERTQLAASAAAQAHERAHGSMHEQRHACQGARQQILLREEKHAP